MTGREADVTHAPAFASAADVLEAVIRASPLAIMVFDAEGTTIGWNPAAERMLGWTAAEALGGPPPSVPPEKRDEFRRNVAEVLAGAALDGGELERVRKDGTHVRLNVWTAPFDDTDGAPAGVVSILADQTEPEARLRRLVESNIVGIALTRPEGVVEANDEFLRIVGRTRAQLAAGPIGWDELTPPEHDRPSESALAELLERGAVGPAEREYLRPDGARVPVLVGGALVDRDPPRWISFAVDLSDRALLLERMRRLQALTAALAAARTTEEVARATAEQASAAFGAMRAILALRAPDGMLEVVGATGADERALAEWRRFPLDAPLPLAIAIRTGEPVVAGSAAERLERYPELRRFPGGAALAAIPLLLAGEAVGALVISFADDRSLAPADVDVLLTLGRQCAQAFERVRLDEAERAARERAAFLAEASELLGRSLDVAEALGRVGRLAVPRVAGSFAVFLREGDALRALAVEPAGAELEPVAAEVLRTGEPLVDGAVAAVPLYTREETFGALVVGSPCADLSLARDLARRAAVALENARLHESESRARELAERNAARVVRLQSVAARLAGAATTADVLRVVLGEGIEASGARAGVVCLLSADGEHLDAVAFDGYREGTMEGWTRFPVSEALPVSEAVRLGCGRYVRDRAERDARYPAMAGANPGSHALVALPLTGRSGPLGGVALSFGEDRDFPREERELLETLAGLCGQALERARLYEEREERATASFVLEHVADGVFQLDEQGRVGFWNPAAERITGVPAAEAVGRRVEDVLPGFAPAEALGRQQPTPVQARDGELWLSVSGVEVHGRHVYAFRDLTEERSLEHARREFLATASHELRTPLASVYGAAQTVLSRDLDEGRREELLGLVVRESERLARIVDDLISANRLDLGGLELRLERCDAAALVAEVVEAARRSLPEGLVLELDAAAPCAVDCDRDRLRQVVANLVENAVKYSPDGGRVVASVERVGGRVRLAVRDEGLGIPAAERERIFEKFYRLDPDLRRGIGGTGLGLYICRQLVERMGGRIWVEPRGRGSRFVVSLPES